MSRMWDTAADMALVDVVEDAENSVMEMRARWCVDSLTNHYPDYPWIVGWAPGEVLVVKLLINHDYNYGYTIDAKGITPDSLAHMSMLAGGELLERLGLRIGRWDGSLPTQNIEGVDPNKAAPIFKGVNRDVEL